MTTGTPTSGPTAAGGAEAVDRTGGRVHLDDDVLAALASSLEGEVIGPQHDEYDVARQGLISHHHELVDGRHEVVSIPFRYVWPAELDLMAQLAGLRLRERRGGWRGEAFTSESQRHVSVWERPLE